MIHFGKRWVYVVWLFGCATAYADETKGMPWVSTSYGIGTSVLWGNGGHSQTLLVTTALEFSRPVRSFEIELSPTLTVPLNWGERGFSSGFILGTENALLFKRGSVRLGPNWESSLGFFTNNDISWAVGLEVDFNGECNPRSLFGRVKPAAKIMFEVEWEPADKGVSVGSGVYMELKMCRR